MTGIFNSLPSQKFTIDFYASPKADPSGYGQGQRFLGSVSVTTNASGNASISATLPVGGLVGQVISATATAASGDTSEFSKDVTATAMASRTALSLLSATGIVLTPSSPAVNSTGLATGQQIMSSALPAAAFDGNATVSRVGGENQSLRSTNAHLLAFHRRGSRPENDLPFLEG